MVIFINEKKEKISKIRLFTGGYGPFKNPYDHDGRPYEHDEK